MLLWHLLKSGKMFPMLTRIASLNEGKTKLPTVYLSTLMGFLGTRSLKTSLPVLIKTTQAPQCLFDLCFFIRVQRDLKYMACFQGTHSLFESLRYKTTV